MKSIITIITFLAIAVLMGCNGSAVVAPEWDGVTYTANSLSFDATFQRDVAQAGSWHMIVNENGSNADLAFFTTKVTSRSIFEVLQHLGATPGNNVTSANMGEQDMATEGTTLALTFTWTGAPKVYTLAEIITEKSSLPGGGPFGVSMKFGGNYQGTPGTNPSDNTGCITCFYTCPAGITSNANANSYLYGVDGAWRYVGNLSVLPADGTKIEITIRLV